MKKWKLILSYVLVAAAASLLTLTLAFSFGETGGGQSKLDRLESLILEKFIGEKDAVAMEDAAANAMVDALGDRWSYYISASEYQKYQENKNNAYVGIGVTITVKDYGVEITQVTPGGSAEEAGVLVGDVIIGVDGQNTEGMETAALRDLIKGEAGTEVSLTVRRNGEAVTVKVLRRQIRVKVAVGTMLEGNVGLVRIVNFNENCAQETIAVIKELMEQGAEKLVFDVRNNPGGYASELVKVLDYLLPEGPLFRTVDYAGRESVETSDAEHLDLPMAVLVNGSSYSAAEFFAAALSEYDAAAVVGEQTCGKGYFQNTYLLGDGSAVGLSVGKYFTPKGVSLTGVGITPDVVVPVDGQTASDISGGNLEPEADPQIQAALKSLG